MSTVTRIDDCLSTRDGVLFIEACHTLDLLGRFGSPLFVVSENQIRRNVRPDSSRRSSPAGPMGP